MEVQKEKGDEKDIVLASSGTAGSVSVALHPLVIMNISEHYTRIRAQEGKPNPKGKIIVDGSCQLKYPVYKSFSITLSQ